MNKKNLSLLIFLMLSAVSLPAAIQHCHTGIILSAELTKSNVQVFNLPALAFPNLPPRKVFAAVTIKPDNLRDISIFDYTLEINGTPYPCVAIRRNNRFEYFTEDIRSTNAQQLLFIADASQIPAGNKINAVFKSNLSQEKDRHNVRLMITVIGNRQPTPLNKIPATGTLEQL